MVKVKICGFTRTEDVKAACEFGVDMVGAIVKANVPTPRNLTIEQARDILDAVTGDVYRVVVIMPENPKAAEKMAKELEPDYIQVHSAASASQLREIGELTGSKLIGVVQVPREGGDPIKLVAMAQEVAGASDYLLLDTEGPSGGETGLTHNWKISREICAAVKKPVFLAGGLNPTNVGEAIEKVRPHGVDVASGVESAPGEKDPELMRGFIQAAKR